MSRLAGIDTLRGFAAAAVFVCHMVAYWPSLMLPGKLTEVTVWGAYGVDIFIVISGFCLMMPVVYSEGQLSVGQFYGRRAWRILPAYWVALAIAAVLAMSPVTAALVVGEPATIGDVVIHAVGMQTWVPPTLGSINGSLWSVSLEIQLYIVFPLLIVLWRKWGIAPILIGAALLSLAWSLIGQTGVAGPFVGDGHALPARLMQFAAGMACAVAVVRGRAPRGAIGLAAAVVGGVVGAVASVLEWPEVARLAIWALVGVGLILWVNELGRGGKMLRPLESFGARSYSFYLLHQPILLLAAPLVALIPGGWIPKVLVGGTLAFAAVTGAAALLYRWVELPSHRLGRRFFPRPTPRSILPSPA